MLINLLHIIFLTFLGMLLHLRRIWNGIGLEFSNSTYF